MQNDLRATSDKNTSFNTSKNMLYVKSGFQVIETQHWKTDNYLPKFKLRELAILLSFYFHEVSQHLNTFICTNFRFERGSLFSDRERLNSQAFAWRGI